MKSCSGSYVLIIEIIEAIEIRIGKLGPISFIEGFYGYVGSAMNHQLFNRVHRHVKPPSKKHIHWHIDYLLAHPKSRICKIFLIPNDFREECLISNTIKTLYPDYIPKFGCSDCLCASHLYYFGIKLPELSNVNITHILPASFK